MKNGYNYSIKELRHGGKVMGLEAVVKYQTSRVGDYRIVSTEYFGKFIAGARPGGLKAARQWCLQEIAE